MKNYTIRFPFVHSSLKILFFLYLLFFTNRILFIGYFHERYTGYDFKEILFSFLYGLKYDTALALLLLIVPLILLALQYVMYFRGLKFFLYAYLLIILALNCFCLAFDVGIYDLSQIHLNFRILNYIKFLSHGIQFSDPKLNAYYYSMLFVQVVFGLIVLWILFIKSKIRQSWLSATYVLIALVIILSSVGVYKSGKSAQFSTDRIFDAAAEDLRDLSTNVLYNVVAKYIAGEKAKHTNPFMYSWTKEAVTTLEDMNLKGKDSTIQLLNTARPNIVLFMLESFTADVIQPLGGDTGVTPNLSAIIKDGLLFSNIYSPGYRTDQGLACLLNGFPTVPDFSIEMDSEKSGKLPFITNSLHKAGYHSNLYYGGDIDFANMKTYFGQSGIQKINDSHSFPGYADDPKWGVHDGHVFMKQAREAGSQPSPFFSMIISLSSHEPFALPIDPKFAGNDLATKFKNTCFYTDQSIGKYLDSVRNLAWYKNTLFVFVADHGHNFPRNRRLNEQERFHIPMIFYGEPLKPAFRGARMDKPGMQSDLVATLLSQLNLPHDEFRWSNDLMNVHRKPFVYYCFDSGMGWVEDSVNFKMDFASGAVKAYNGTASDLALSRAKAYLQVLVDEYLSY